MPQLAGTQQKVDPTTGGWRSSGPDRLAVQSHGSYPTVSAAFTVFESRLIFRPIALRGIPAPESLRTRDELRAGERLWSELQSAATQVLRDYVPAEAPLRRQLPDRRRAGRLLGPELFDLTGSQWVEALLRRKLALLCLGAHRPGQQLG